MGGQGGRETVSEVNKPYGNSELFFFFVFCILKPAVLGNANKSIQKCLLTYSTSTVSVITSDLMGTSVSPHKWLLAGKAFVVTELASHALWSCKGRSKNLCHLRNEKGNE